MHITSNFNLNKEREENWPQIWNPMKKSKQFRARNREQDSTTDLESTSKREPRIGIANQSNSQRESRRRTKPLFLNLSDLWNKLRKMEELNFFLYFYIFSMKLKGKLYGKSKYWERSLLCPCVFRRVEWWRRNGDGGRRWSLCAGFSATEVRRWRRRRAAALWRGCCVVQVCFFFMKMKPFFLCFS